MYRKTRRNRKRGSGTSKLPTRMEGYQGKRFPRETIKKRATMRATGQTGIPAPRTTSRPRAGSATRSSSRPRSSSKPRSATPKRFSPPKKRSTSARKYSTPKRNTSRRTTTPKKKSPPRPRPPSRKRVGTASTNTQRPKTTSRIDRLSAPKKKYSPPRAATPISKPTSARRKARYSPFAPSTPVSMQGPSLSQQRAMSAERKRRKSREEGSYGMMSGTGNYGR